MKQPLFKSLQLDRLRRPWHLARPWAWQCGLFVVLGLAGSLVEGLGIGLTIPLLQGQTEQSNVTGPYLAWLNTLAGSFDPQSRTTAVLWLILAAMSLKAAIAYAYTALNAWISNRVQIKARKAMFRLLLESSQQYLDSQEHGMLLRTLSVGPTESSQAVTALLWLVLSTGTILVFSALLMAMSWRLVLLVAAALLLLAVVVRLATRQVGRVAKHGLREDNELSQRVKEALLGITTVRAFGREAHERRGFEENATRAQRLHLHRDLLLALTHPLSELLSAVVLVTLVYLALDSGVDLAVLAAMTFMLLRLQPQIQNANANLTLLAALDTRTAEVLDLMDLEHKPRIPSGTRPPPRLREGIRCEQLDFTYPGGQQALRGVELLIPAGRSTALVGRSGSGKSTLINLLCRFCDPTSGCIRVEGVDLRELDLAAWRGRIALVSQDVHIFSGSIRDNIRYGRLEADEAEIMAAAASAHAHDFIMELPDGYDARVGERGMRLSGGQRQRLSIARAILRDPQILVLDEATNALDSESESHIKAAIEELGKERTLLVVAHRRSSIERADHILVLDQGRLVEQGSFTELMAREGLFARLFGSNQT